VDVKCLCVCKIFLNLVIFQGRDAASKSVASDVAAKSGSGPSDSSTSSVLSPSQTKKTATITTPGRDVSKVELVAQLSSRLAKLTDAATASNVSRPHPTTTRTNVTDQQASSPSTESSSRTQSVLKTSNKPGDREGSATKQRNPGSGVSRPETMLANHNNKNSNLQQHTQVYSLLIHLLTASVSTGKPSSDVAWAVHVVSAPAGLLPKFDQLSALMWPGLSM